jgi:hypothetical protein
MDCDTKAAEPQVGRFHAVEKHIRWTPGQLPDEHSASLRVDAIEKSIPRRYYARARIGHGGTEALKIREERS